jgi:hypothetical protein
VANAKPGEQASIFGTDVRGQPVDVNGDVVQKASNWGALLSGKQPKATSSAFSAEAQAARKEKEAKKAAAAELAAVPATTLRVPKPHDKKGLGWRWRPDVEWAHEHRAELVAFLQTDLKDETTSVGLREGTDCAGWEYIEYSNLTDTRKAWLSKKYEINFAPAHGGPQAVLGAISKAAKVIVDAEEVKKAEQAERDAMDACAGVAELDEAAVAEVGTGGRIEMSFKEKAGELQAQIVTLSQQMALDPSKVVELSVKVGQLSVALGGLSEQEAKEKAEATAKFAALRERISKRVVGAATNSKPRRQQAAGLTATGQPRQRAPATKGGAEFLS